MKDWIKLTAKEKKEFKRLAKSMENSVPKFFTLESDKHDPPSRFAEMTKKQVIEAAEESAKFIFDTLNK